MRIRSVLLTDLGMPEVRNPPSVTLEHPSDSVSLCQDIDVLIFKVFQDGLRGLSGISWALVSPPIANPRLEALLAHATSLSLSSLRITRLTLLEF